MRFLVPFVLLDSAFVILGAAEPPTTPLLRIEAGMHTAPIRRISASANGKSALTCSFDKTARLWSIPDGNLLRTFRVPIGEKDEGRLNACALSPDGRLAVVGGNTGFSWDKSGSIYVFDTTTGQFERRIFKLPDTVVELCFSPDGSLFAAAFMRGGFGVWRRDGGVLAYDGDFKGPCYGLAWQSSDTLATACLDSVIRVYSGLSAIASKKAASPLKLIPDRQTITTFGKQPDSVSFSPNGKEIAVTYADVLGVSLLDSSNLKDLHHPSVTVLPGMHLMRTAWSADGAHLAAGGIWVSPLGTGDHVAMLLWDDAGRGRSSIVPLLHNTLFDIQCLPDDSFLFCTGDPSWGIVGSNTISKDSQKASIIQAPPIVLLADSGGTNLATSPDVLTVSYRYTGSDKERGEFSLAARQLRSTDSKGDLALARRTGLDTGTFLNTPTPKFQGAALKLGEGDKARCGCVSSDGSFCVIGGEFGVYCFDASGKRKWAKSSANSTGAVSLSSNGELLIATFSDGTIRWHRSRDGEELLAFFPHADRKRWVLWTPQGYYDASADGESLIGWHVNRGKDQAADFFPASKFRDQFYRPDIIDELILTWDTDAAVKKANQKRGKEPGALPKIEEVIVRMAPPVVEMVTGGPTRTVELPEDAAETTLSYRVRGGSTPVSEMRVLVDSRPVEVKAPVPGDDKAEVQVTVPLPNRDCVVALLAGNRHAFSEPAIVNIRRKMTARPSTPAVPQKGTLYILAVGVSLLKNQAALTNLAKLEYADDDATAFHAALAGQKKLYRAIESRVLTDDKATAGDILDALDWLKSTTKPEDTTLILLAGHGESDAQGRYTFCAHDYDRARRLRTGVGFEDIKLALGATKGEVVLFLDACSSGSSLGEGSKVDVTGLVNQLSDSASNIVVFASSDGRTPSLESDDLKQGLFTHCVKLGLGGKADLLKNGRITLSALQTYVDDEVRKLSSGNQIPVINIPKMVPNLTLGLVP